MRALISVSDKTGLPAFAKSLSELGYELVSSGGTKTTLDKEGIKALAVEDVTGFPECLGGRVKTLHPNIHAGILANRFKKEHMQTLDEMDLKPIDLVVVNLYPFEATISKESHTFADAIENIDIGGPSLIRAAAKNHSSVLVVTDVNDYAMLIEKIKSAQVDDAFRLKLAQKAFALTAKYDTMINDYLLKHETKEQTMPEEITLNLQKAQDLRYGENPHQGASFYKLRDSKNVGIEAAQTLHGKELSYNNFGDAQGAISLALEFSEPVCVAVKHATPCGVAIGATVEEAYQKAHDCDPVSIFGGVICFNRSVNLKVAEKMSKIFLEVIIAPEFDADAFELLSKKGNLRLLKLDIFSKEEKTLPQLEYKTVGGGILVQESDSFVLGDETQTVTKREVSAEEKADLLFGMAVVKHVKSNAIVLVRDGQTVGIGGGEVSRIWAAEAACTRAGERCKGAVMASDAFFPFPDVVELCAKSGVTAIIQPGGSNNDNLSIEACDKANIAMIFTKMRHFKH